MADETTATDQPAPNADDQPAAQDGQGPAEKAEADGKVAEAPKAADEKKYQLKDLKGNVRELTEAELVRLAQKGFGADLTFQQAAAARKTAEEYQRLQERIKSGDKRAAIEALGLDPYTTAEELMAEKWRQEQLPPEARELEKIKSENDQLKQKLSENYRLRQEQELAAKTEAYQNALYDVICETLDAAGDIPKNSYMVSRCAAYIQEARDQGVILTPDQLTALVRQDIADSQVAFMRFVDADRLIELLGDETMAKLREADVKRLEKARAANFAQAQQGPRPAPKPRGRPRGFGDFDRWYAEHGGGT
jgi:hypothetical protein